MTDLTDEAVKALADAKPGNLFVDQDEDVCIDDGRRFNLIFCPARDAGPIEAGWAVLNPDVVAEIVARYNVAPDLARALLDARAELAQARADAQAAVAGIVRSVWGRCEALEDEAADKLAQLEKLTDHEKGFWRGQKTVAKSIRRSTEMPTAEAIAIRRAAEGEKA